MLITPETPLSRRFEHAIRPHLDAVAGHALFRALADGSATLDECRAALLGFYPLVAAFPCYLGVTRARIAPSTPHAIAARAWFHANLRVEANHARWWIEWGRVVGLTPADFRDARPSPAMAGQNAYLLSVATRGSIAEAAAAINYAVEGATGLWTRAIAPGMPRLAARHGLVLDRAVTRWLRAHARYDDAHPREALEVVKVFARDELEIARAARAAVKSLLHFAAALDEVRRRPALSECKSSF
jgi:pyrroloquinoline quinone (PQQ) biosynthesis protein C